MLSYNFSFTFLNTVPNQGKVSLNCVLFKKIHFG